MEADFRCLVSAQKTRELLEYACNTLESGLADVIRLRSLKFPGHPIHSKYFYGRELENDDTRRQLYHCTHNYSNPDEIFPEYVKKVSNNPLAYQMTSKHCVYTNNPTLITKKFYAENILPYIEFGKHLEPEIDRDWANKFNHKIIITEGLFTHIRLDGHEGKNCWCCPVRFGGTSDISNCTCCKGEVYNPQIFFESDIRYA